MKIPSPGELGMPAKFDKWRPAQEAALEWLWTRTKRVKALSAPTGFGKLPLVIGDALHSGEPTCFVTESRGLQDQAMRDFGSIGLVSIKGRRNYQCDMHPDDEDYTCESGYAAQCPYKGTLACPSSSAEMRAATSRLVVTNYDKWTSAKKYGQGMSHFSRVVFDEGHEAPNALARAMQVVVHHRERERHIAMDPPMLCEDMAEWKRWACEARVQIEAEVVRALAKVRGGGTPTQTRHYLHMRNLNRRLVTLSTCVPSTWVVEEIEKGFQFDTVRPGRYAESSLLLRVPSVLVVSATLRPKTLFMLGQAADSFDYREFDSEFDAKRNPIYWVPTMRVSGLGQNLAQLWTRHDQIAARRRDRNGIVHPISYSRGLELAQTSRFSSSMHLDTKEDQSAAVIERFRDSYPGAILVSPAVQQGHDFPMSEAEWQFIAKIPFPPPSKILKARTEDDKEYPYYLAMQKLVQMCGRIMRSREDQGENFLGDDHAEWFIPRYGHLAPRSFHAFFRQVSVIPPPPPPLERR